MKAATKYSKSYFNKFSEKPVEILPFNQAKYDLAQRYVVHINKILEPLKIKAFLRGSTLFKISGKGDIEVGIYLDNKNWYSTLIFLINEYGSIGNLGKDYARFNIIFENEEIEVILQKGKEAEVDRKLTEYLLNSPQILKEYESIKKEFSYSKRVYQIEKNRFLSKIIESL